MIETVLAAKDSWVSRNLKNILFAMIMALAMVSVVGTWNLLWDWLGFEHFVQVWPITIVRSWFAAAPAIYLLRPRVAKLVEYLLTNH